MKSDALTPIELSVVIAVVAIRDLLLLPAHGMPQKSRPDRRSPRRLHNSDYAPKWTSKAIASHILTRGYARDCHRIPYNVLLGDAALPEYFDIFFEREGC